MKILAFIPLLIFSCSYFDDTKVSSQNERCRKCGNYDLNIVTKNTLINKAREGDANAAYDLFCHYNFGSHRYESAYYWASVAVKLGCEKITRSDLIDYEKTIYDSAVPIYLRNQVVITNKEFYKMMKSND